MHSRFLLIASAALVFSASAAAEPPKADAHGAAQPKDAPKVMLASAEQVQAAAPVVPDTATPVPVKKRAARVTSCRCGGQTPEQQQQNP